MKAEITPGRSSVCGGGVSAKRMALVVVALVAALWAALLVVNGVGPEAAEAQTAQTTGTVVAWGYNPDGRGSVPPSLTDVETISAGASHNLALKDDGTVVAWGSSYEGQTDVPPGLTDVEAIDADWAHSLALKEDGTVVAWGDNYWGQTDVPPSLTGVEAISAGGYQSLALKDDETVVAWGVNDYGQTRVPPGLTGVEAIAAGDRHNLALKEDGTVVAWGDNSYGQADVPPGLTGVEAIDAGWAHSLALKEDGTVVAWGFDVHGQTDVPPGLTGVGAISAGGHHNLALVVDTPDTTAPTIRSTLDPASPGGQTGWYTGAVSVSWTVTDDESAISGQTGCDTQTVSADTAGVTFTCSATSEGGTSSESVTVKRDATGPDVDLVSRTPAANANGWNNTDVTVDWSCGDATSGAVDPGVSQTHSTEGRNQSAVGSCTDNAGNTASDTQTGINIDKTAPVLNPAVSPDPVLLNGTTTVAANATDALSGIVSQGCDPVDDSSAGYKTVACTATDHAGNTATANATYQVVYDFAGFSQPVDNLGENGNPVLNEVKAGKAIPLKWRITDADGAPITTLSSAQISVAGISCSLDTTLDQLEEVAAGGSGLQNLGDGYYQLNWKSPTGYANSCKRLRLNLAEGSVGSPIYHTADFRFTK